MVDELEESTPAQRALLEGARRVPTRISSSRCKESRRGCRSGRRPPSGASSSPHLALNPGGAAWFHDLYPGGEVIILEHRFREPEARASGSAPTSAPRRRRRRARSSTCLPAAPRPSESASSRRPGPRGRRGRGGDGGARHPLPPLPGRRRSSSAPRCATRSPGCGYSPIPTTPPPRPAR